MELEGIRNLIINDPRPQHAFSPEVRRAGGRYARRRRAEGARWCDIEQELGLSSTTARNWMRSLEPEGFQQVVIVDVPQPEPRLAALTLTSPSGFALSGISFEQAAALLQRLR